MIDENENTAVDTVTITITTSSSMTLVGRFDKDSDNQIGNFDVLHAVNAAIDILLRLKPEESRALGY